MPLVPNGLLLRIEVFLPHVLRSIVTSTLTGEAYVGGFYLSVALCLSLFHAHTCARGARERHAALTGG